MNLQKKKIFKMMDDSAFPKNQHRDQTCDS